METVTTSPQDIQPTITDIDAEEAVKTLLAYIGQDVDREGLLKTPSRVCKAFWEMTRGYRQDPAIILATQFTESCDEFVILNGIRFTSLCEHHLLPFVGTASVGYLPTDRVVGLSKLARLVECFASRLQVQERMTTQIAEAVMQHCNARGVGVVIKAHHECMACRGVRQLDTQMITSSMLGMLRDNNAARLEFLSLISGR